MSSTYAILKIPHAAYMAVRTSLIKANVLEDYRYLIDRDHPELIIFGGVALSAVPLLCGNKSSQADVCTLKVRHGGYHQTLRATDGGTAAKVTWQWSRHRTCHMLMDKPAKPK